AAKSKFEFGKLLARAVRSSSALGRPVILPMEDESCAWLLADDGQLADRADWLLPPKHAFAIANNKADTMRLAAKLRLPCPLRLFPVSQERLLEDVRSHPQTRWLAKPVTAKGSAGILYEKNLTVEAVTTTWARYGPLLLQERIPAEGTIFGVSLVYDR